MLLEAQKGPESLQEALKVQAGNHRSQQEELRTIIDDLRLTLNDTSTLKGAASQDEPGVASAPVKAFRDPQRRGAKTQSLLESLPSQMGQLSQGLGGVQAELAAVKKLLESKQDETPAGGPSSATAVEGAQAERLALLGGVRDSQRTLGGQIRTSTICNAVFSYTAATLTVGALFLLLRGSG